MKIQKIAVLSLITFFLVSCASNAQASADAETVSEVQTEAEASQENDSDEDLPLPEEVEIFEELPEENTDEISGTSEVQEEKLQDEEGFYLTNPYETFPHINPFEKTEDKEKEDFAESFFTEEKPEVTVSPETTENIENTESSENTAEVSELTKPETYKEEAEHKGEHNPEEAALTTEAETVLLPESEEPSLTDENENENADEEEEEEPVQEELLPSRKALLSKNQFLDIVYPGTGWVYVGEKDEPPLLAYFGRKIYVSEKTQEEDDGAGSTLFTLRARAEGTARLNFYKIDRLTGEYIEDCLEVTVTDGTATTTHVTAPSYADVVPPRPNRTRKVIAQVQPENIIKESSEVEIEPYGVEETKAFTRRSLPQTETKKDSSVKKSETPETAASSEQKHNEAAAASQPAHSQSASQSEKKPKAASKTEDDSGVVTVIQDSTSSKREQPSEKQKKAPVQKAETQAREEPLLQKTQEPSKKQEDQSSQSEDELLSLAQKSYDAKKYQEALDYLEKFFKKATAKIDEGLFIQAKVYESSSEVKDIKKALDTYETIVNNYPESIRWNESYERMTYLKRFYFSIR